MWVGVIRFDYLINDWSAEVWKAPEGQSIAYSIHGMRNVKNVYPFKTKRKAEEWQRTFNMYRVEHK